MLSAAAAPLTDAMRATSPRRVGAPGRREVGHGKLAWRALHPMLPTVEEFPYTIRVLSDITESNGSSSMATVCGGSLALMDAGVPLKRPVAGIAMGLILEGKDFAVISDILGDEDHLGDMDFKVAGTSEGITSLQMDIKVAGITEEIMKVALAQAKDGRAHILGEMAKALDKESEADLTAARTAVKAQAHEGVAAGVARLRAERFLDPHQIDQVDWAKIPGVSPELAAELAEGVDVTQSKLVGERRRRRAAVVGAARGHRFAARIEAHAIHAVDVQVAEQ